MSNYNEIIVMKQQRKKQKISQKRNIKIEHKPTKIQQNIQRFQKPNKKPGLQNLPTIQTMLEIPKQLRNKHVKEMFQKVRPFIASYMIKKQGSRVLQLIYKWGSEDIRASIFQAIVKNWKELIKSKYALYTISKVSMNHDIPNLMNDVFILQNNSQGAVTIENFIAKNPQGQQARQIYRKIESIAAKIQTTGNQSMQTLHNLAMKSIEKGYYNLRLSKLILRLTLPTLFDAQKQKTIEFLIQNFGNIIDEEQGIRLFIELVNNCDSKQKKQLIKQFKNNLKQIMDQSTVSYIAILKLITETDDTVSIGKKLIPELIAILPEIEEHKKLYNILFSLLSDRNNNFNCLGKFQPIVLTKNCKKSEGTRIKQIRQYIYNDLVQFLVSQGVVEETCKNRNLSRVAIGTIKSMQKDQYRQGLEYFSSKIFEYMINDFKAKTKQNKIEQSLIADSFGSKLLKCIIFTKNKPESLEAYCTKLSSILSKNIKQTLESKATFVLSALVESTTNNDLMMSIKKSGVDFDKVLIGKFYKDRIKGKK